MISLTGINHDYVQLIKVVVLLLRRRNVIVADRRIMSLKLPHSYVLVKSICAELSATAALSNGRGRAIDTLQAPGYYYDNVLRSIGINSVLCVCQGRQDVFFVYNIDGIRNLVKVVGSLIIGGSRQLNVAVSENRAARARHDANAGIAEIRRSIRAHGLSLRDLVN